MSPDENKPEPSLEEASSDRHLPVRDSESLTNVFSELRAKRPATEPEPFRIPPRAIAIIAGLLLAIAGLWALTSVNWVSDGADASPSQTAEEAQPDEQSATNGSGAQVEQDVGEEGTERSGSGRANATGSPSDPWMPSGNGAGSESALPSRDGTDSEVPELAAGSAAGSSASEPAEPPARTLPALLGFVLLIMVFETLRFAIGRERARWLPQFDLSVSILFVALLAFALVALTSMLTADNHQPAASPVSAANPYVLPAIQLPPSAPVPPPQPPSSEHAESAHGDAQEERAPATISAFVDSLDSSATDFAQLAEALRPPETASIAEFVTSLETPEEPGQFEQLAAQLHNHDSGAPPVDPASEIPGTELDQPETDEEPDAQNADGNDEPQQGSGIPDEDDQDDDSANPTEEVLTDVEEPSWAGFGCRRPRRGGIWDAYRLQCLAREFGLSQDDEEPSGEAVEQPGEEAVEWPSEEANARTGEEAIEWPGEEAAEQSSGEAAGRPSGEAAEQPSGDPWPDSSTPPSEQAGAATEPAAEEAQYPPAADQSEPEAPETNNDPALDPSAVAPLDEPSAPAPEQPAPSPPPPFAIGLILGGLLEGLAAVARVTWQHLQKSENDES